MATAFHQVTNNAYGKLSAQISASATSIVLGTGQGASFPATGKFFITIVDEFDSNRQPISFEIVEITSRSTDTLTVQARGSQSTTAKIHLQNAEVFLYQTSTNITEIQTALNTVENQTQKLDANGNFYAASITAANPSGSDFTWAITSSRLVIRHQPTADTNGLIDFDPQGGPTQTSNFRFFRSVNTSGNKLVQFYKGDGGGTSVVTFTLNATANTFNMLDPNTNASSFVVAAATATVTIGAASQSTAPGSLVLRGPSGTNRSISWLSTSSQRWLMQVTDTAEAGSNAGSNFELKAYTDAAALIDIPISITRAAGGNITITRPIITSAVIYAPQFRVSALNTAPASATATGGVGDIRFGADAIYVCTAANTWKRAALSTW